MSPSSGPLENAARVRPARGRPRDPAVDDAVIALTLEHLARDGYEGMSIAAIAAAAGVGKPSIYRRWKGKADLATAALQAFQMREPRVRGMTTRERLVSHLRGFRRSLLRPNGMAMLGTLLAEEVRTPELLALFRDRIVKRRRRMLRELLDAGVESGELRAGLDSEAVINAVVGSFYARYLAGNPISSKWPERIVALVWPSVDRHAAFSSRKGERNRKGTSRGRRRKPGADRS